jgi:hypothetical protein
MQVELRRMADRRTGLWRTIPVPGKMRGMVLVLKSPQPNLRTCSECGDELPRNAFSRRRHYVRAGVRAACKRCTSEATKLARAEGRWVPDPEKQRVRARTRYAIKSGKLTPEPCTVCGSLDVHAHHRRYDGVDAYLDVEWLCTTHHGLHHGIRAWTRQLDLFPSAT